MTGKTASRFPRAMFVKSPVSVATVMVAALLLRNEPALAADGCPAPSFAAARTFAAGDGPNSLAVGDFNADGKFDLAAANVNSGNVSVLLGKGDGTFQTVSNYYVAGKYPQLVAVGDVNSDDKLDLIVVNNGGVSSQGNVAVLLGKGDGSFQKAVNYVAGAGPSSVAIGDFDGDDKPDLAVANAGGYYQGYTTNSSVSVLLGKGDGTFRAAVNYDAGNGVSSVAIGDFNGDGKSDLAVAANTYPGNVSVLLGKGDGTFQSAVNYGGGAASYSISVGDFNGDGKLDLALANHGWYDPITRTYPNTGAAVLLGNGDGTFQSAVNYHAGSSPACVAVGDLNGDGKPDLAVANYSGTTAVLLGNGDGTFQVAGECRGGGRSVALGDYNGDDKTDLAVTSGGAIAVLIGGGDGSFHSHSFAAAAGPGCPSSVALGDFNGDGKSDLVVGKFGVDWSVATDFSVLLGNSDGSFQAPLNTRAGYNPFAVTVADFDGDGLADLVVANSGSDDISIRFGNGDGTFGAAVTNRVGYGVGWSAAGDFNVDGKPDLAVATGSGVSVLLNNGDGAFQPAIVTRLNSPSGFVTVGDLNADNWPDLIVVSGGGIRALLGRGDGTFEASFYEGAHLYFPTAAVLGDFNSDGKPDLAVVNFHGIYLPQGAVVAFLGNGDGTLRFSGGYFGGGSSIAAGDFNGDGKLDLVTSKVSVLLGHGDGTFQTPVAYDGGGSSVAVGDFNGDGKPDLAAGTCGGVSLLLNTCPDVGIHAVVVRSNSTVTLSWPLPYSNFVLESTASIGSTNWQCVPESPTTNNGRCEVTVPLGPEQCYFRLRKP